MQTIEKEVAINAPKEKVWEVLTKDENTRDWYAAFSAGSHAQTDWQEGSKAIFTDHSGCGLIARIIENKPAERLAMQFEGVLTDSREDYDSPAAQAMKGGKEIYRLAGENGTTHLHVWADMDEKYVDMMSVAWDAALVRLKSLAEKS